MNVSFHLTSRRRRRTDYVKFNALHASFVCIFLLYIVTTTNL